MSEPLKIDSADPADFVTVGSEGTTAVNTRFLLAASIDEDLIGICRLTFLTGVTVDIPVEDGKLLIAYLRTAGKQARSDF